MAVHHSALNIKFMVICNSKIYLCHSCKYCNEYDHTSFTCILDCLSHGDIISSTIIDNISLIRSKCLYHCLTEIFVLCIYTYINSTFFCFFQTKITYICDHNFCSTHSLCRLCYKISDRTGTYYCNIHSCNIAHLLYPMNCNCKWLNHSALFK